MRLMLFRCAARQVESARREASALKAALELHGSLVKSLAASEGLGKKKQQQQQQQQQQQRQQTPPRKLNGDYAHPASGEKGGGDQERADRRAEKAKSPKEKCKDRVPRETPCEPPHDGPHETPRGRSPHR